MARRFVEGEAVQTDCAYYREQVGRCLSAAERRRYQETSWVRSCLTFATIWLGLAACFVLVVLLHAGSAPLAAQVLLAPVVVFYVGTRINAFAVQVHEASHGLLMKDRRWNDRFCNLLGGYWVLNDVASYWRVHSDHHTYLHEATDPDLDLYLLPPGDRRGVLRILLRDFFCLTALGRVRKYLRKRKETRPASPTAAAPGAELPHLAGKATAQLLVLGLFVRCFGAGSGTALFALYWLTPLFCVFPVLIRIRISTEHYSDLLHADHPSLFVSRTSVSNRLEEHLLGTRMEYHFEHHLYPNLPYHQLARLHRLLVGAGFFDRIEGRDRVLSGGYIRFWRRLLSAGAGGEPLPAPTSAGSTGTAG